MEVVDKFMIDLGLDRFSHKTLALQEILEKLMQVSMSLGMPELTEQGPIVESFLEIVPHRFREFSKSYRGSESPNENTSFYFGDRDTSLNLRNRLQFETRAKSPSIFDPLLQSTVLRLQGL